MTEIEPADLGERLRAEARQEAERLRRDPAYAAEMHLGRSAGRLTPDELAEADVALRIILGLR